MRKPVVDTSTTYKLRQNVAYSPDDTIMGELHGANMTGMHVEVHLPSKRIIEMFLSSDVAVLGPTLAENRELGVTFIPYASR